VLSAFDHQIRSLPPAARTALVTAAADDTGDPSLLHRAGLSVADLQLAEERGLVLTATGMVEFRHPLIRSAAYHGATLSQRIAAHRSLADACIGSGHADRRAWHLALAPTSPDEQVAIELEQAGDRSVGRNGQAAAAAAYERAAQLSEDPSAAARRLVLAAEAAADGGQLENARALAESGRRTITDPVLTARLIQVHTTADLFDGALLNVHAQNTAGAAAITDKDPDRACWMLIDAAHAALQAPFDRGLLADAVDRFGALGLPEDHPLIPLVWLIRWDTAMTLDRSTEGFAPLGEVIDRAFGAAMAVGPQALLMIAVAATQVGREDAQAEIAATVVSESRTRGVIGMLPSGLAVLAMANMMLGRYRDALISATEARELDLGQRFWTNWACVALAHLAAIEGGEQRCRELASEVLPAGQSAVLMAWMEAALALLDLGHGRIADAFARLDAIASGPAQHSAIVPRTAPDLVETAVRVGRPDRAAEALACCARWALLVGQPWIAALQARCQALTAPDAEAEQHYQRALKLHEHQTRPFDQARTELLYGEWLRRSRRRRESRIHLRAALEGFEAFGARPWAHRARSELVASGAPAPQAVSRDIFAGLTPQELQITRLAARGLQNRDIAAQLFLSQRTVAYHLGNAYPKLGIRSRAELSALVPAT
jgi:DNA-binding CsgD family transcriptional regulator